MKPWRSLFVAVVMAVTGWGPARAAAQVDWPKTELGQHTHAWFDMLRGDEAAARTFLTEHMAPSALAQVGSEERLARRRGVIERTGGLTPRYIVLAGPVQIRMRCEAGNGDVVVAVFDGEPEAPHRILSVRLEATPPGSEGPAPDGAPAAPGPPLNDAEAVAAMRDVLRRATALGDWSGAVLVARDDDVLLDEARGLANREAKAANTVATRFNVGSLGKLFTRAAIAQLAQAGKLSLDDKLSRFLPRFPHADSITIAMLCSHRSGVGDIFTARYQSMDRAKLRHNRDYLALIRDQPLWFAPGTSERYSNGGYVLLGEVIAKASGEDYYEYLAKHVFTPAGMSATGAPIEGDGAKGVARGYTRATAEHAVAAPGAGEQGERDNVATRPARGSAAGGSYSTTHDLMAFDRALLSGKLCAPGWADWVTGGPRPDGAAVASMPEPSFGFAGGAPGLNAEWTREGDRLLIVLTNRDPETARGTVRALRDILERMPNGAQPRP